MTEDDAKRIITGEPDTKPLSMGFDLASRPSRSVSATIQDGRVWWYVHSPRQCGRTIRRQVREYIEAHGRDVPMLLPPAFAKHAREAGADPATWVETKPMPLWG